MRSSSEEAPVEGESPPAAVCGCLSGGSDGGLVGAGALGYAVALGVSRSEEWGKGMAAGISIVRIASSKGV